MAEALVLDHVAAAALEHRPGSPHQRAMRCTDDAQGSDPEDPMSGERATRSLAARAVEVTGVDWDEVGCHAWGTGPPVPTQQDADHRRQQQQSRGTEGVDLQTAVNNIAALFMVRLAAVWDAARSTLSACEAHGDDGVEEDSDGEESAMAPLVYAYRDFSTTTVCQQTLQLGTAWPFLGRTSGDAATEHPEQISELARQVRQYIATILGRYDPNLPYHNYKHAYHVVLSVNKLLDLMLRQDSDATQPSKPQMPLPPLFGLRRDANLQLALLFAALVHDADHRGVTNRQLVREASQIALLYNDTSVQENNSLSLAFQTLLKGKYALLRACMFPAIGGGSSNPTESDPAPMDDAAFQRFRSLVINLVLSTDIASPERSQLGKAVFKEAFRSPTHHGSNQVSGGGQMHNSSARRNSTTSRRGSLTSEISMPRIARNPGISGRCYPRRRNSYSSACSLGSDMTSHSLARMKDRTGHRTEPVAPFAVHSPPAQLPAKYTRRGSTSSDYDSVAFLYRREARTTRPTGPSRRLSNDPSEDSYWTENGIDSIDMRKDGRRDMNRPAEFYRQLGNHESFALSASSIGSRDGASLLSSPSRSTHGPRSQESLPKQTSLLPSLTDMEPAPGLSSSGGQNGNPHRRCRISRRWSTEMSGLTRPQRGNHSADLKTGKHVSRLVHEYYGYGDCCAEDNHSSLGESDENSSLSLTPPSSDDEMDGVVISSTLKATRLRSDDHLLVE